MRSITYDGKRFEVEIVSLVLPGRSDLMSRAQPLLGDDANLTMVCPVELPPGARFKLDNADHSEFDIRVVGCAPNGNGRFVVLGCVK